MKTINVHIYPSPFMFESRILRQTRSIIEQGLSSEIEIASRWKRGLPQLETIDSNRSVRRFQLLSDRLRPSGAGACFRYLEFILKVWFWYKRKKNVVYVNCHSLFVLPIGYLLKVFKKNIWLIYDAHELESEKAGLGKAVRKFCAALEGILIKKVDHIIVVSPSIASWYKTKYKNVSVTVIRNTPETLARPFRNTLFNDRFSIPLGNTIFLYQGVINKGRGIELLIETFKKSAHDKHIVFMGYGSLEKLVVAETTMHENIHFMPAVPPRKLLEYTCGADVGLSIIENISLSYYYCLPNKVFEYLHCELPIIVSNFPDMSMVVEKYNCGWITSVTPQDLLSTISIISSDTIKEKKEGVKAACEEYNWQEEAKKLPFVYERRSLARSLSRV